MGYRTILLDFQDPERAEAILQTGIGLAREFGAHLIGLYVIPKVRYFYEASALQVATEVYEAEERFFDGRAAELKNIFEREVPGDMVSEWRSMKTINRTVEHALCADLVITTQSDPNRDHESNAPEQIVMESGRPVLVLPYAGEFKSIGSNILVAWNATREAARAAFDALPLLKNAKNVKLLWINPGAADGGSGSGTPGSELAATLSRHGVNVEASHSVTKQLSVGDELLSRAADQGADLIVMGAYGHSRVREYVFGGATHHILGHMTVPVLLSH